MCQSHDTFYYGFYLFIYSFIPNIHTHTVYFYPPKVLRNSENYPTLFIIIIIQADVNYCHVVNHSHFSMGGKEHAFYVRVNYSFDPPHCLPPYIWEKPVLLEGT